MTYAIHPRADIIPAMSEPEYQALLADIKAHGLRDPITLYSGKVLDGRHRLRACEEAGIEPRFDEHKGSDPAAVVLSRNLKRRHLNQGQIAMVLIKMDEVVSKHQAEAQERIRKNWKKGSKSRLPSDDGSRDGQREEGTEEVGIQAPDAELPHAHDKHAHTTMAKIGQAENVSEKTMERAKYVDGHGTPEDVMDVLSGKISVSQKEREVRRRQKANKKPETSNKSREKNRDHAKSEEELMAADLKTCLETLKRTLRALKSKVISQEAKDKMKATLEGLRDGSQQGLRQLSSVGDKSSATRRRRRARTTTTPFKKSRKHGNLGDMLNPWGF